MGVIIAILWLFILRLRLLDSYMCIVNFRIKGVYYDTNDMSVCLFLDYVISSWNRMLCDSFGSIQC